MKIPKIFFHETITDWLATLFFQGECIGHETLDVYWYYGRSLNVPDGAQYALIVVDANPYSPDTTKVIRFWEDGTIPDSQQGMPLGDLGVYEVKGKENLQNFRMIAIEPFYMQIVQVQYFG